MTTHAPSLSFDPYSLFAPPSNEPTEPVYALIQRGPPVSAEEVESHLDAVEITVRWGSHVLTVAHLADGQGYTLGEGGDFVLPEEVLGGPRYELVVARGGATFVRKPRGEEVLVTPDAKLSIELGAFTVDVVGVRAGRKLPIGFVSALAGGALGFVVLSFFGHTAVLASLAMFMPAIAPDDAEALDRSQLLMMRATLDAAAEKEQKRIEEMASANEDAAGGDSARGEAHQGESGEAGTTKPVTTNGRMAFRGNDAAPQLSRREERELAATFGLIGIIAGGAKSEGPASPWATDEHAGQDAESKLGKMFGADPNDAMGYGLGLYGVGEGGGRKGTGIGIDGVGTIGGGTCDGCPGMYGGAGRGDANRFGNGHGTPSGAHVAKAPRMREMTVTSNGSLPPEAIQRVVRMNFGRFRTCYESALRTNPSLTGRVTTKFVIDRQGAVMTAQDGGSDLPNQEVVRCIVRSFQTLSFPTPEHGLVTVSYPIVLTPAE